MTGLVKESCPDFGPLTGDRSEFGVLLVAGFGEQRPGAAVAAFAGALFRWLFRWNARPYLGSDSPPTLSDTVLAGASRAGDGPAHVKLAVPMHLNTGRHDARWLLAESSWADLFTPPKFLGVARWIWKVSTCLLVLQFVIPMHRHWNRAKRTKKSWHRRWADRLIALCYPALMGVAAMASVLLSLALLALTVVEKLPIPRIDQAVRWVAVQISAVLGDSYMLAHCPVQFAAMRTQVSRDLRWLQERCDKVAVVAHSQGAAIAHQVLKDSCEEQGNVQAFITIGQGISKLHLLWRMDWDPRAYKAAWWSRVLVTTGMFLAGLPVLGIIARHWTNVAIITILTSWLAILFLLAAGFATIGIGVRAAMRAVCGELEQDLALPEAGFWWSDYYASADPVSNGPIADRPGQTSGDNMTEAARTGLLPRSCNQVYNSASILFDHNRYLRNQDQLLSQLVNDLAAAAYGHDRSGPKVVADAELIEVGKRRHHLTLWLIAARILAACLAVGLWWADLSAVFERPIGWIVDLLAPHTAMGNGYARFLAATLITAVFYLALVIVWRIRETYVVRRFFHTAQRTLDTEDHSLLDSAVQAREEQTSFSVS